MKTSTQMNTEADIPSAEEFIERLKSSLEYCQEVDDLGSVHHCMGRWQEWVKTWPQIYDEHGGL